MTLWDGPRQREAYEWFTVELANLRAAFRWAADHNDLDTAAAIAVYATFLGYWVQQYEASTWAEDLIEPAMANGHRRLAQLYTMAAVCYMTGRIQDFLNYADAGQRAIETGRFDVVRIELDACLGGGFLTTVGPDQCVEWARGLIARDPERSTYVTANLVFALEFAGNHKDALVVSTELLAAVETRANPTVLASALLAYGHTHRSADPTDAASAFRRGLAIAQANGDRQMESVHAMNLASLSVVHAAPMLLFSGLPSEPISTRAASRTCRARWASSPLCSTASATTNRPPSSVHSPIRRSRTRHIRRSSRPSHICVSFSATKPTSPSPESAPR